MNAELPVRDIRNVVNQIGREAAIESMAAMFSNSMGNTLSEEHARQLCTALVDKAIEKRPRPGGRR